MPKDPKSGSVKGHVTVDTHNAPALIEEAVVHLHGLAFYCKDQLEPEELEFIAKAKRNLAIIHRRLQNG